MEEARSGFKSALKVEKTPSRFTLPCKMKAVCKVWMVSWNLRQYIQEPNFSADWGNMFIRKLMSTYKATQSQRKKL